MNPELLNPNRFTVGQKGSERGELLDKFLARLNPPRVAEGFRPLSHSRLSAVLSHIPTDDLYAFLRQCEAARSFSRFFWWSLKPEQKASKSQQEN